MTMAEKDRKYTTEQVAEAYQRNSGNVSATARELGIARSSVRKAIRKTDLHKKPLAGGTREGFSTTKKAVLPSKGLIKRYICTSAQNNTHVNKPFWNALLALADYYDAEVLVGTFSYNQNNFGKLSVKAGKETEYERELWFDPALNEYMNDESIELGNGLVWCGEMNILPTAVNPLAGLETYTHRKSAIFPHAKVAMRSIATMQGEGTKLNFTTGTVTLRNYIQKKEGIKAEHHHRYAALVVEVNHDGQWWVRQIGWSSKSNVLQDLDVVVKDNHVTTGNPVEAITWGDLHATHSEEWVVKASLEMLDVLKPQYQFLHDILEGASINRHVIKHSPDPHYSFNRWLRGLHRVDEELKRSVEVVKQYLRPWCDTIVPDSNHDGWWLKSWLAKYDYRYDPANAELFLDMQMWFYSEIKRLTPEDKSHKDVNLTKYALEKFGLEGVNFLLADESFTICNRKIECGMHGHLGPNGAPGSPTNLSIIGRRANTGHTHSAGIWNGLYVAGTTSKLKWSYTYGPSSWSHSHIVTYPNGMRAIVTMWNGKWRA
jgi:Bacterial regulatory protein, Fis family